MSEKTAMTAAERQRKYRQKNRDDSGGRIDMQVSARTRWDLEDLAERYSVTKKELIERLIKDEAVKSGVRFEPEEKPIYLYLLKDSEGRGYWKPKALGFTLDKAEAGQFSGDDLSRFNLDGVTLERVSMW